MYTYYMAILHRPPEELHVDDRALLYFLAGPIQGAQPWQDEAFGYLDVLAPNQAIHVASPRREHQGGKFTSEDKSNQIRWEKRNLQRANKNGGVLVWLAKRDMSLPYKEDRAYAQTTRHEFGRLMGWLDYGSSVRVAIGMDTTFAHIRDE